MDKRFQLAKMQWRRYRGQEGRITPSDSMGGVTQRLQKNAGHMHPSILFSVGGLLVTVTFKNLCFWI